MPAALDEPTRALLARAAALEKHPLARLISVVERDHPGARVRRAALFRHLAAHAETYPRRGRVIGVTGTPGAGKSSLIGRVALEVLATDPTASVAVLAIDPTSPTSGGALLGDRVRTSFPVGERRIYFRSQATQGDLGGVGRRTFAVSRLLRHLFDFVFVETVGIGQSEIEISALADRTLLVLQPLGGDHVQFLKAGVMEVPDAFVINKCDEAALARRSAHELRTALECARIGADGAPLPVFLTSAVSGAGVPELTDWLRRETPHQTRDGQRRQERHFLRRAIAERYGAFGVAILDEMTAAASPDGAAALYEDVEAAALDAIAARVR
ncbi:MAG: protein kinase [bacterium]|nr:protein kinase [bacterium]